MTKKSKLSDEDRELFRQEVGDVRPLSHKKTHPTKSRAKGRPLQTELDQRQVLVDMMSDAINPADIETGEELLYVRDGIQHNVMRKLRRGKYTIQAELDLHRMTSEQARAAIVEFINRCKTTGKRCVRIVHGKGLGSFQKQPVLKGKVNHWLRQRDDVLAFCSARPEDGGTGAVYVLLRKT
jgi:DNA-nicking Smr family endonuclease